jgi:copper chaperone
MQFHIDNMNCGGCARTVTRAIQSVDPDASIDTDPPSRLVKVDTAASQEQVVAALREAGFPPREA